MRLSRFTKPEWFKVQDGFWMQLDPEQIVDRTIIKTGKWEPGLNKVIGCVVRSGEAVVDIGAHKGYVTCLLARSVGPLGCVLSFDPDPRAYAELTSNIDKNGFSQAFAFPLALGQRNERFRLSLTRTIGNSSRFPNTIAMAEKTEDMEVECKIFDELINEIEAVRDKKISFVKMDAEGSEPLIWAGMVKTLERHRPIVALEINYLSFEAGRFSVAEFNKTMAAAGYSAFEIQRRVGKLGAEDWGLVPTNIEIPRPHLIEIVVIHKDSPYSSRIRPLLL